MSTAVQLLNASIVLLHAEGMDAHGKASGLSLASTAALKQALAVEHHLTSQTFGAAAAAGTGQPLPSPTAFKTRKASAQSCLETLRQLARPILPPAPVVSSGPRIDSNLLVTVASGGGSFPKALSDWATRRLQFAEDCHSFVCSITLPGKVQSPEKMASAAATQATLGGTALQVGAFEHFDRRAAATGGYLPATDLPEPERSILTALYMNLNVAVLAVAYARAALRGLLEDMHPPTVAAALIEGQDLFRRFGAALIEAASVLPQAALTSDAARGAGLNSIESIACARTPAAADYEGQRVLLRCPYTMWSHKLLWELHGRCSIAFARQLWPLSCYFAEASGGERHPVMTAHGSMATLPDRCESHADDLSEKGLSQSSGSAQSGSGTERAATKGAGGSKATSAAATAHSGGFFARARAFIKKIAADDDKSASAGRGSSSGGGIGSFIAPTDGGRGRYGTPSDDGVSSTLSSTAPSVVSTTHHPGLPRGLLRSSVVRSTVFVETMLPHLQATGNADLGMSLRGLLQAANDAAPPNTGVQVRLFLLYHAMNTPPDTLRQGIDLGVPVVSTESAVVPDHAASIDSARWIVLCSLPDLVQNDDEPALRTAFASLAQDAERDPSGYVSMASVSYVVCLQRMNSQVPVESTDVAAQCYAALCLDTLQRGAPRAREAARHAKDEHEAMLKSLENIFRVQDHLRTLSTTWGLLAAGDSFDRLKRTVG